MSTHGLNLDLGGEVIMFERIKKALREDYNQKFKKKYNPKEDYLIKDAQAILDLTHDAAGATNISSSMSNGTSYTVGNVYQPAAKTKKKLPKFKDEAKRIYTEIKNNKNNKYNVTISYNNNNCAPKFYNIEVAQNAIVAQETSNGGNYVNSIAVSCSGTYIMLSSGISTKYPHQSINSLIKYFKELDYNDKLIQRITVKKNIYIIKTRIKEVELYPSLGACA